jgi:hypothetical protein
MVGGLLGAGCWTADHAAFATEETPKPVEVKSSTHPVTQAAVQAGILSSANRIDQISNFLTKDRQSGAFLFVPQQGAPDQQIFSSSYEVVGPGGNSAYASASFAPYPGRSSGSVYDMVEYAPASCEDLETTVFRSMKAVGPIKRNVRLLDGGSVKIFLMPAGKSGCVTIKKEVVQ